MRRNISLFLRSPIFVIIPSQLTSLERIKRDQHFCQAFANMNKLIVTMDLKKYRLETDI